MSVPGRHPVPNDGQQVLCTLRGGTRIAGRVRLVFWAMDTECVKVETMDGTVHVYPEFGDTWEPL